MPESKSPLISNRDGDNQAHRLLAALQADYAGIDEHKLNDWLNFAVAFAKELNYFTADNVVAGDWQDFLNPASHPEGRDFDAWLQQIESFIDQPEKFTDAGYYHLHRPHFVLFLTFLQLLKNTQGKLNQLTDKHLDFYYQQVLHFKKQPPQPDRVNVLFEPANAVNNVLVPKGALLTAGKDKLKKELVYRVDSDLLVNQAKIAQLCSVYVNKQVIGIREAAERASGAQNNAVIEMLEIALGKPAPGDALPLYPPLKPKIKVDISLLNQLQTQAEFVGLGLFMSMTSLRSLMRLKNNRGVAADSDWEIINAILSGPIKSREQGSFTLSDKPRDFDGNIKAALGFNSLPDYFDTLPSVKNFTALYERRTSQDVKAFMVRKELNVESFNKMMRIKVRIDNEWREINSLLESAGKEKAPDYTMVATEPPDFNQHFAAALGTPAYPSVTGIAKIRDLDSFYDALLSIETYFFMPLEDFVLLVKTANTTAPSKSELATVYDRLALAHQKKVYAAHRAQLNELRPKQPTPETQKLAVNTMMQLALGIPATDTGDLQNRIKNLLPKNTDTSLLKTAAEGGNLTETQWDSVCRTLELAWRNRMPTPVAQKINWLSLNACHDSLTAKGPDSNSRYTFGQRQTQVFKDPTKPPPSTILGWAISSPILCLAQGQRTITLSLAFKPEQFNAEKIKALLSNNEAFLIELSTGKGWLKVHKEKVVWNTDTPHTLLCTLHLDQSIAAICALPDTDGNVANTPWPVLRLLLQPYFDTAISCYVTAYPLFQCLLLEKVVLEVDVKSLSNLQLQNDNSPLPSGKPFEPFGSKPAIGARLYFGHPELMLKNPKTLRINLQWMGIPNANLKDYYANYSTAINGNTDFKSNIALVDQHMELIVNNGVALFDKNDANKPATLALTDLADKITARHYAVDSSKSVTDWQRYWFLELSPIDFQHAAYPGIASGKSIALAGALSQGKSITNNAIDIDAYKVNPPYTPKLKSFSIDYTASIELPLAELRHDSADQIYHLHPFGYAPMQTDPQTGAYHFLPAYNNEGELYIGLSGVTAPQMLSILWQMAEGTADPDLKASAVQWSVLNGNCWHDLSTHGQLQADATNGLVQSGIINVQLDEASPSTLLPSKLYWLRASVVEHCAGVCDSIGIGTQAVTATFVNQGNSEDHFNQPLPADTIKKLVAPIAGIAAVSQPFTSFGGKAREQDKHFNTRISERLRHKQRAVSLWDYEHLVLEQFPAIYKIKAIPAGLMENLGRVTLLVIPDIRNRLPFNSFSPKAPTHLLNDIKTFLADRLPLGADIEVKNARYLPVRLRFAVRFKPGYDAGVYTQQLNEAVNRFLSPWAYEQGKDMVIGGKIYANAIINFIERCAYVDYVAHFKLYLGDEGGVNFQLVVKPPLTEESEGYFVAADSPDVVLVAAQKHDIDLITQAKFGEQSFKGINYMKLELDFMVG
ncbi:MAG: baseplate J/gp47 family protein [Gammaproteobacteria bacterium]